MAWGAESVVERVTRQSVKLTMSVRRRAFTIWRTRERLQTVQQGALRADPAPQQGQLSRTLVNRRHIQHRNRVGAGQGQDVAGELRTCRLRLSVSPAFQRTEQGWIGQLWLRREEERAGDAQACQLVVDLAGSIDEVVYLGCLDVRPEGDPVVEREVLNVGAHSVTQGQEIGVELGGINLLGGVKVRGRVEGVLKRLCQGARMVEALTRTWRATIRAVAASGAWSASSLAIFRSSTMNSSFSRRKDKVMGDAPDR